VKGPLLGDSVIVTCQVLGGEPVRGDSVWDKLSDGYYIPDAYTDLGGDSAQPANGLNVCPHS
jgi:hypothetical protein